MVIIIIIISSSSSSYQHQRTRRWTRWGLTTCLGRNARGARGKDSLSTRIVAKFLSKWGVPLCHQTWRAGRWFNAEIIHKWRIAHCHVWLPECISVAQCWQATRTVKIYATRIGHNCSYHTSWNMEILIISKQGLHLGCLMHPSDDQAFVFRLVDQGVSGNGVHTPNF